MDILQELINTFSEDDKKEFRIFINRQKSKKERKDLDLFELIADQASPKDIQKELYKTPNKVAYHTLRKRLLKHISDFIVLKQIDKDPTSTSSISGLISMATYAFNNKSEELGWRFLNKAEQTALENEQYELLNSIYHLQLEQSESDFAPEISDIYNKWKDNKTLVDENEKINIAYNFIKREVNEVIYKGEDKDLNKIIDRLLKKYGINDLVFQRPEVLYKVLDLTRRVMLSKKDFYNFEPYVIRMYEEMVNNYGFSGKNHLYKIHILYMIAHILYRNRHFERSNHYMEIMHEAMLEHNEAYYNRFYPKYVMLSAANYSYLNQNDRSITILSSIKDSTMRKLQAEDQLNIKMNLIIYYGNSGNYRESNRIMHSLNHSDKWLSKKMGIEWVMKKNMIEIMIQYELGNFEIALNRIRSFERTFAGLFKHPLYARALLFMQKVKIIINNPMIIRDNQFIEEVISELVKIPAEQEDLQAMAYYAWLKGKLLNVNYYQVLLEIANKQYDN
ncbi:MAG: hypothetical protein KDD41_02850 [Flavobacteriales bacterium]|nr:hypothetical protein [Flavobacteriales bacterium]